MIHVTPTWLVRAIGDRSTIFKALHNTNHPDRDKWRESALGGVGRMGDDDDSDDILDIEVKFIDHLYVVLEAIAEAKYLTSYSVCVKVEVEGVFVWLTLGEAHDRKAHGDITISKEKLDAKLRHAAKRASDILEEALL